MIYGFIKKHETVFPIEKMRKVMGVGVMSYYDWKSRPISDRVLSVTMMKEKIWSVYYLKKQHYGSLRITAELKAKGYAISRNTVAKYMNEMGLRSKLGKKRRTTTDSKHSHAIMENVLNQEFEVSAPSKVWVSDITYIQTREGFLYLKTILDLFDRKCIGWSISKE